MKAGEAKPSPKEGVAHPGKGVGQGTPCQSCICRKFRWIPGGIEKVLQKAICGDLLNKPHQAQKILHNKRSWRL